MLNCKDKQKFVEAYEKTIKRHFSKLEDAKQEEQKEYSSLAASMGVILDTKDKADDIEQVRQKMINIQNQQADPVGFALDKNPVFFGDQLVKLPHEEEKDFKFEVICVSDAVDLGKDSYYIGLDSDGIMVEKDDLDLVEHPGKLSSDIRVRDSYFK